MTITKRDALATLAVFVALVLLTEVVARMPRFWREGREDQVRISLTDLLASSRGGKGTRYESLPMGKADGLEAGRARLAKWEALAPTPEALFPLLSKNYLVEFFVDKFVHVSITEHGSSWSSARLETPNPLDGSPHRPPEQVLTQGDAYAYVTRLYMLEYLPVRGAFKLNLAFRKLSGDPRHPLAGDENVRFAPEQADERFESSGGSTSRGEGGVKDKIAWNEAAKAEDAGTFVYRAFVYPDRRLRRTLRGGYWASEPVVLRVFPPGQAPPEDAKEPPKEE
jgi:hypothetical protein